MPPWPSSPGFPDFALSWARCLRSLSSGWRTLFMTSAANVEERGHPWLTPSVIEMVFHLFIFHL